MHYLRINSTYTKYQPRKAKVFCFECPFLKIKAITRKKLLTKASIFFALSNGTIPEEFGLAGMELCWRAINKSG